MQIRALVIAALSLLAAYSHAGPPLVSLNPSPSYNGLILQQIQRMPSGGGYAVDSKAAAQLRAATTLADEHLHVQPVVAQPSYCSGATYLVFLSTITELVHQRKLTLNPTVAKQLLVTAQPDGSGIWGRWNANGPGTARLFHELNLGANSSDFAKAQPGDFMKIFWSKEVGRAERGHSVIYLGTENEEGVEHVRFWSSNKPGGFGEKSVPRTKIAQAIFSRLQRPENVNRLLDITPMDAYLASLLKRDSSFAEALKLTGVSGN